MKSGLHPFKSALARAGYDYEAEESGSLADIYCRTKQLRTRGSNSMDFLKGIGQYIPMGISAKGEGEIDLGDGITVEHVAGQDFEAFRRFLKVDEAEFQSCFSEVTGGVVSDGGRSGSLYWFSKDGRYILKSATSGDVDKIEDFMSRYVAHFQAAQDAGMPCFLLRFFGLYRFRHGDDTLALLCMNDVWNGRKPSRIYDLKGTTMNRYTDVDTEKGNDMGGVVLKELNLDSYFTLGNASKVSEAFEHDSAFLESENSIDYSLLLGIDDGAPAKAPNQGQQSLVQLPAYAGAEYKEGNEEEAPKAFCAPTETIVEYDREPGVREVRFGIIDFLTQWNSKKKAERWYKNFFKGGFCEEHSTMPPDYYRARWQEYMDDKIIVEE